MTELGSVIFYISIFAMSALLLGRHKKSKLFWITAVIIPSLMAGLRLDVGTDWSNYNYDITIIRNTSFKNVISGNIPLNKMEYGYMLIVKILSSVLDNNCVFFFFSFLTVLFITKALIEQYGEYDIGLAYFVYLLVYFSSSLNLMRQSLAVAVVFWAMKYVFDNNWKKYITTCLLVMILFHFSAILAIPIYFLWNHKWNAPLDMVRFFKCFVVVLAVVLCWKPIVTKLANSGFSYVERYLPYTYGNDVSNRDFYMKILILTAFCVIKMATKIDAPKEMFVIQLGMINILIAITGFYVTFVKRIGLYYEIPILYIVCNSQKYFETNSKKIVKILVVIFAIMYFVLVYYILGQSEIIPYKTKWMVNVQKPRLFS